MTRIGRTVRLALNNVAGVTGLRKLAIVGAGSVGTATAYACLIGRLADEIVLYDIDGPRVRSEVLDLRHGVQFTGGKVDGGDDPAVVAGADVIVITAGATHPLGQTRLDLAGTNAGLVRRLVPTLVELAPATVVLMVTNPVDVVTYVAQEVAGLPHGRVLGSGTVLDTSRLRGMLADRFGVSESSVHASIVGEHGDSEIALWSSATVGGVPLSEVRGLRGEPVDAPEAASLVHDVRHAAAKVIEGKGCTNFAIGLATARIVRAIAGDEHAVLPVSVRTTVEGVGEVCLSLPSVVGRDGVLATLWPPLDDSEREGLRASAAAIRSALDGVA